MKNILTLNKIAVCGLDRFDKAAYAVGDSVADPQGIMVRSAAMHDMELPASLLAIARAGAGTNNIPVDKCSDAGIVVFNTPGANANAVKELVIAALLLSSRKIVAGIEWAKTLKGQGEAVAKLTEKGKSAFAGPEIKALTAWGWMYTAMIPICPWMRPGGFPVPSTMPPAWNRFIPPAIT